MTTTQKNRDTLARQRWEMFHAVEAHDYDTVLEVLEESPELLDKHEPSKYTLLHKAVEQVDPTMVALLLARGASQQLRRSKYRTALELAMRLEQGEPSQRHQVVRLLIEHGADPFATPKLERSAVWLAILRQDADLIRLIFSRHPDQVNEWCCEDRTPLGLAIDLEAEESVRVLCACGADPESTGLMYALRKLRSRPSIARILIEAGAEVNRQDDKTGMTCLHRAAYFDNGTALASVVLECNANVHARNHLGETALTIAAAQNHLETMRLLLSYGAEVQAANGYGVTALYRTAMQRLPDPDHLQWCLTNIKTYSEREYTRALAKRQHTLEIARLLLEAGAAPDAADVSGITPIHVAIGKGNYETAALLLAHSKHYQVQGPETMSDSEMDALFEEAMRANPNCLDREGFDRCFLANTNNGMGY